VKAQQLQNKAAPMPLDILFGNNRVQLQLTMNKAISENGKFVYFNAIIGATDYKNTKSENESIIINWFGYKLSKNFSLNAGAQLHFIKGLVPQFGARYSYADRKWLVLLSPSYFISKTHNVDVTTIIQFRPPINEKLNLYTHLEGKYEYNLTQNGHDRSFFNWRLGLMYKKYAFGAGSNLDWYGPLKVSKQNYGIFGMINL